MPQHKFILPPTIGNKALCATSYANKSIHITLCNAPAKALSELLLKLAEIFEAQNRIPFVFFDFFNETLAIRLQCENIIVSTEKADGFCYKNRIFVDVEAENPSWNLKSKNADMVAECEVFLSKAEEYMKIAGRATFSRSTIILPNFNSEKAAAAISRIAHDKTKKHCSSSQTNSAKPCEIQSSYCFYNSEHLPIDKTYLPCYIKDKVYAKSLFMELIWKEFLPYDKIILRDIPMGECVGIIVPKAELAFIPYDEKAILRHDKMAETYKILNLERFVDTKKIRTQKAELKFLSKCISELSDSALNCLNSANSLCEKSSEENEQILDYDTTSTALSISRFCNSYFI